MSIFLKVEYDGTKCHIRIYAHVQNNGSPTVQEIFLLLILFCE